MFREIYNDKNKLLITSMVLALVHILYFKFVVMRKLLDRIDSWGYSFYNGYGFLYIIAFAIGILIIIARVKKDKLPDIHIYRYVVYWQILFLIFAQINLFLKDVNMYKHLDFLGPVGMAILYLILLNSKDNKIQNKKKRK